MPAFVQIWHGAARRRPRHSPTRSALEEAPEKDYDKDTQRNGERQRLRASYIGHDHWLTSQVS